MATLTTIKNEKEVNRLGPVIWMFGLSGSGKSTLANGLSQYLTEQGQTNFVLDGDELRNGINKGLGFSEADRIENLRRAAEVAKLFQRAGVIPICSFITPTHSARKMIENIVGENFYEIFVQCSLATCEQRDVKGLYKKARAGEIPDFTGVSASFELPSNPFLKIDTEQNTYSDCLNQLIHKFKMSRIFL